MDFLPTATLSYVPCVRCKGVSPHEDNFHRRTSAAWQILPLACHLFAPPPPPLSQFGSVHLLRSLSPIHHHLVLLPPFLLIFHGAGFGDCQTLLHLIRRWYIRRYYLKYVLFQPLIMFWALSETKIHTRPKIPYSRMISNNFNPISVPPWKPSNCRQARRRE